MTCAISARLSDQDPRSVSAKLRSYTINSDFEVGIIGDETCAILGKFRAILDPSNHGIRIDIADVSNSAGQINTAACRDQNNPPMSMGLPPYTPIVASLYQRLPKDIQARTISTHGFTGLQYIYGRDGKSQLQIYCY